MKRKNLLKSLSKLELLELLAEQEQEIQELKQQLEAKNRLLEQRTLCMEASGNIAQAALALNGVFETAQKAADQYLESVKWMIDKNLRKEEALSQEENTLDTYCQSPSQIQSVEQNPVTEKNEQTSTCDRDAEIPQEAPFPDQQEDEI